MHKTTRTEESRRVNGHASFLCIWNSDRITLCGLMLIVILCGGLLCGCGKKNDAVYIAAEERSGTETGTVLDDGDNANADGETDTSGSTGSVVSSDSDSADGMLYVYVCGAVESPGLYELENGSRVYDAIMAAGGLATDACPDYWNQAEYVSDGQMIDVPTQTEVDEGLVSQSAASGSTGSSSGSSSSGTSGNSNSSDGNTSSAGDSSSGSDDDSSGTNGTDAADGTTSSGKININTATQEELVTLSGIGEARASAIISYREEHGAFSSIEDIKNVSGIGDALYEKICDDIVAD